MFRFSASSGVASSRSFSNLTVVKLIVQPVNTERMPFQGDLNLSCNSKAILNLKFVNKYKKLISCNSILMQALYLKIFTSHHAIF